MIEKIAANNTSCIEDLHEDMEFLETVVRETNKENKKSAKKSSAKKTTSFLDCEAVEDDDSDDGKFKFLMIHCVIIFLNP